MYKKFATFLSENHKISVIQAENPDGDSLGSALALEEILSQHDISLYCPVEIPKYLRYLPAWSRVTNDFDSNADAYIIVDTAAEVLLSKILANAPAKHALVTKPVFVIDHHETPADLTFEFDAIIEPAPANCDLIFKICKTLELYVNAAAAQYLLAGILSDTLGLTSSSVSNKTLHTAASLLELGANIAQLEENRRDFMKKSPRIMNYKADLIRRIEYHLDGRLATVHITWDDIKEYSDEYNPNVLILEEMRFIEGVEVAVAIKTYPDGKLTGKVRSSSPIAAAIAAYFGGGGHHYAAGFRVYAPYEEFFSELIAAVEKVLVLG
jgi:phosphoesterase RecJ-like protein